MNKKDKCPECYGTGEGQAYPHKCSVCNGTGEKKLDSPELIAKIIRILDLLLMTQRASTLLVDTKPFTDQIIALLEPLIEEVEAKAKLTIQTELALERDAIKQINEARVKEAKREEGERIWAWGHLMCDTHEHTNIPLPKEMGGGEVKKNNRRRRRCVQCWDTLLNGKP